MCAELAIHVLEEEGVHGGAVYAGVEGFLLLEGAGGVQGVSAQLLFPKGIGLLCCVFEGFAVQLREVAEGAVGSGSGDGNLHFYEVAGELQGGVEVVSPGVEAAAEAGDLDALAAIVEAAAESAKADAETAKAAAETTQAASDTLQEQVASEKFEFVSDETEYDVID